MGEAGLDSLSRIKRDTELMASYLRTEEGERPEGRDHQADQQAGGGKKGKGKKGGAKQVHWVERKGTWVLAKELKAKKKPRRRKHEEVYTDKDRAAAVNMGTRDIKQSLKMKKKEERSRALQIPEETKAETLLALAGYEAKARRHELAFVFITKAIDLKPEDKAALAERCKCYLLLGEPALALRDAEAALNIDPHYIKEAEGCKSKFIFSGTKTSDRILRTKQSLQNPDECLQAITDYYGTHGVLVKAESLYHLGRFEEALVFFHRGLKLRPHVPGFGLGVAKSTEAIRNIIGDESRAFSGPPDKLAKLLKGLRTVEDVVKAAEKCQGRPRPGLLGPLQADKEYLERILKEKADVINLKEPFALNETELYAREILKYLGGRSEFWRQQKPKPVG